jgi:hypothetical protein
MPKAAEERCYPEATRTSEVMQNLVTLLSIKRSKLPSGSGIGGAP